MKKKTTNKKAAVPKKPAPVEKKVLKVAVTPKKVTTKGRKFNAGTFEKTRRNVFNLPKDA